MILRDYQERGVFEIRSAFSDKFKAPLYVAPCGSGKTVLFAYIAAHARARGNSTIIIVHRQELLNQTCAALKTFGVSNGVILSGKRTSPWELIHVASVQTLARRLDRVKQPKLLVVDEAHHASASTWSKILAAFSGSKTLGVTATPWRMNGEGLSRIFDKLILGPSVSELISGGWLAPPKYYVPPPLVDMDGVKTTAGDYQKDETAARMDKPHITGDAVSHYLRICPGVPAVAFCTSIKHADHVAEAFTGRGIPAASIDGGLNDKERADRIDGLAGGRLKVLTSCDLINEGFDLPAIVAAIMLRPTQSLALYIQQAGRALRPAPGKAEAIILDHVGNVLRHDLLEADREWTLDGLDRKKQAKDNSFQHRQCPKCYLIYSAFKRACPACGATAEPTAHEIEQREGELKALEAADLERMRRDRRKEMGQAETVDELIALGVARKYRNPSGWARHVLAARERRQAEAANYDY